MICICIWKETLTSKYGYFKTNPLYLFTLATGIYVTYLPDNIRKKWKDVFFTSSNLNLVSFSEVLQQVYEFHDQSSL